MRDFLTAIGLVLVIEGAVYALFPEAMQRFMRLAQAMPAASLRNGGLVAAAIGFAALLLMRRFGAP